MTDLETGGMYYYDYALPSTANRGDNVSFPSGPLTGIEPSSKMSGWELASMILVFGFLAAFGLAVWMSLVLLVA